MADGHRRFTSVYIEMARKGAKSTLSAGVALYGLCCEGEVGPQVIIGATTGEQAGKVFFGVRAWARSITCADNGGFIQPINAKGSTQDGWNPHIGILDELQAHKTRALYDVIKSAFGARQNPLLWAITTAGYNMAGVCYEQHLYVRKMLEGIFEADHYFGIIFTLDEGDDPYDERVWIKANPMLGVTPTLDGMARYAKEARASPASEGEFKTKRLNVWLSAAGAWLNMAQWDACADPAMRLEDFEGCEAYVGCDIADKDDVCSIGIGFFRDDLFHWFDRHFLPAAALEMSRDAEGSTGAPYRSWAAAGHLDIHDGNWIDHGRVEALIRDWCGRFAVRRVTFDQFAAARTLASRLNEDLGDPDRPLVLILPKSAKNVTDGAKDLEARVKARKFRHTGNPVLKWMASNVVVSRRIDGTLLPKKEKETSPNKIDGIDAVVNALSQSLLETPAGPSLSDIIKARGGLL